MASDRIDYRRIVPLQGKGNGTSDNSGNTGDGSVAVGSTGRGGSSNGVRVGCSDSVGDDRDGAHGHGGGSDDGHACREISFGSICESHRNVLTLSVGGQESGAWNDELGLGTVLDDSVGCDAGGAN